MNDTAVGLSTSVDTGVNIEKSKHVDPAMEKHSHDADEAMKAVHEMHGEAMQLDEASNRRLLSIIDWHMMPIMCFIYGMNFLDSKNSTNQIRLKLICHDDRNHTLVR